MCKSLPLKTPNDQTHPYPEVRLERTCFYCAEIHSDSATNTQLVYLRKIFFCESKYLAYLPGTQGPRISPGSCPLSDFGQQPPAAPGSYGAAERHAGLGAESPPVPHAGLMPIIHRAFRTEHLATPNPEAVVLHSVLAPSVLPCTLEIAAKMTSKCPSDSSTPSPHQLLLLFLINTEQQLSH